MSNRSEIRIQRLQAKHPENDCSSGPCEDNEDTQTPSANQNLSKYLEKAANNLETPKETRNSTWHLIVPHKPKGLLILLSGVTILQAEDNVKRLEESGMKISTTTHGKVK